MILKIAAVAALLSLLPLPQETPAKRHEKVVEHLKAVAAELSAKSLLDVPSLDDWKARRPGLKRQLLYMLGLDPLPERTPLKAEITGTVDRPAYRIEKLVFQSRPGLYVTGNFYLPKNAALPLPTVLYVCGHSPHPMGAKVGYQDRVHWYVEHGYACLILDTLEFGEVAGVHHGLHDLNLWDWQSRGYIPSGVEVWNAIRAVDWLETRPEVDRTRIGLTGISGGGATTWFTAAVEDRIAVAAPVCSTYTFGSQAAHWVAAGQCDCIYFNNTFLVDFPVVGALIAPRPLLICSGQRDGDFPPDGYHEVYRRSKIVFDLYEGRSSERIKEVDDDVGHSDPPLFRKEARQWMNRWLRGDAAPLELEPIPKEPRETPETLACLSRLPADALNYRIQESFVGATKPAGREELIRELGDKVFRWFPKGRIPFETRVGRDTGGWAARYADFKELTFDTERGVPVRARLLTPKKIGKDTPLLLYVKRAGDTIHPMDHDELLPVYGRCSVLILMPRLTEHPVTAREYADIERSASWVGRTIASMQVWDILRAVEWIATEEKIPASSITVYGKDGMGVLGLYAGLLDPRVGGVVLQNPPSSHAQGPALLNVLRITDIPEVAKAFAPRKIRFIGKAPAAFGECSEAGSLPEALEVWKY
ncbi:MAG: acetylxylan esterase [Planctomycetes bacterium]|nr:acetylxylan esterase [Planctomycetota bacterium]